MLLALTAPRSLQVQPVFWRLELQSTRIQVNASPTEKWGKSYATRNRDLRVGEPRPRGVGH